MTTLFQLVLLKDQGSGGEAVVVGQSSSSRSGGAAGQPVDFTATSTLAYTVEMVAGDGFAFRVDFIGNENEGFITSSKNIVRTFLTIRQVGWQG